MTLIVTSEYALNRIAAPALPVAPVTYEALYQDQFSNTLRLYFNRIEALLNQLETKATTATLLVPYGVFHQDGATFLVGSMTNNSTTPIVVTSTSQFLAPGNLLIGEEIVAYTGLTPTTFTGITRGVYGTTNVAHTGGVGVNVTEVLGTPSPTSAIALPFTATDASYGVRLDPVDTARITTTTAGVYNFTFSAQFLNFTTVEDNVTMWFRKNGVDVPYSAGIAQVNSKHGAYAGSSIITWNLVLDMNVNDYVELVFSSDSGNSVCATFPAGTAPVHPVSPSLIMSVTFVSALPA